jgi:hypothetical protein
MKTNSTTYVDMDGVLVDFSTGAVDLLTRIMDGKVGRYWLDKSKHMRQTLRRVRSDYGDDWRPRNQADLYLPLPRKLMYYAIGFAPGEFFSGLPPLQDGIDELWDFVTKASQRVKLLSAPINARRFGAFPAAKGKRYWAEKWLSPAPLDVIVQAAKTKADYAQTDGVANVLIDDTEKTISAWRDRGGIGILHKTGDSAGTIQELTTLTQRGKR